METILQKDVRPKLEDVTFDIQYFISEHAQFLSPSQSSYLLKFLNSSQRALRDRTEELAAQRSALNALLDARQRENQEKVHQTTSFYWWAALTACSCAWAVLHTNVLLSSRPLKMPVDVWLWTVCILSCLRAVAQPVAPDILSACPLCPLKSMFTAYWVTLLSCQRETRQTLHDIIMCFSVLFVKWLP